MKFVGDCWLKIFIPAIRLRQFKAVFLHHLILLIRWAISRGEGTLQNRPDIDFLLLEPSLSTAASPVVRMMAGNLSWRHGPLKPWQLVHALVEKNTSLNVTGCRTLAHGNDCTGVSHAVVRTHDVPKSSPLFPCIYLKVLFRWNFSDENRGGIDKSYANCAYDWAPTEIE